MGSLRPFLAISGKCILPKHTRIHSKQSMQWQKQSDSPLLFANPYTVTQPQRRLAEIINSLSGDLQKKPKSSKGDPRALDGMSPLQASLGVAELLGLSNVSLCQSWCRTWKGSLLGKDKCELSVVFPKLALHYVSLQAHCMRAIRLWMTYILSESMNLNQLSMPVERLTAKLPSKEVSAHEKYSYCQC